MTKAERIFQNTRYECKRHIIAWGYEENVGFNTVIYADDETVCKRTLNDITARLERAKKMLKIDVKLGVLKNEEAKLEAQVLKMVEKTIENTVR